ncbi:MAG TPA: heme exporter protein CcmB [Actinomycetota bacterium]
MSASAGFASKTLALTRKDLKTEARGRDTLPPMLAFAFAVTLLLAFVLPGGARLGDRIDLPVGAVAMADVLAGFLYVTILFAGLIGFARTFEVEREEGAIDALLLAPVDRSGLYLSKAIANLLYLVAVELFVVPVFALLFTFDLGAKWFVLALVLVLVDLGFVAVGTLFASLAAQTKSRELMLPILALPVLVPIFIAGTQLTADLLSGEGLEAVASRGWFVILIGYDVIFSIVGALAFEFVVE